MKRLCLALTLLIAMLSGKSQQVHHRIIYDLASADTADHNSVLRQFNNILKEAPDAELEVVCHGPAVYMMVRQKAFFEERMNELRQKAKVAFKVCANSLRRLGIDKSELISIAEVVPVSILELSDKQQKGWAYIKAGH